MNIAPSQTNLTPQHSRAVHSDWPQKYHSKKNHQGLAVKERRKMNFECEICMKRLPSRREYIGHMNGRHLGKKPFACELCGRQFAYITSLPMHRKTCPAIHRAKPTTQNAKLGTNASTGPSVSNVSLYPPNN